MGQGGWEVSSREGVNMGLVLLQVLNEILSFHALLYNMQIHY